MDTLVFDIETQNFFTDPGVGRDNFEALKISVVGVYSYKKDAYFAFEESEMESLATLFREAETVVGFNMNRYDVPVLNLYFQKLGLGQAINLWNKKRIDILEKIESVIGKRVSLNTLSEANLGEGKGGHGAKAIELYKEGKMDELKTYCIKDVELTKRLYDFYLEHGYFFVPDRETGEKRKVEC